MRAGARTKYAMRIKGRQMSEQAFHGHHQPVEHHPDPGFEPGVVSNLTNWLGALTSFGLVAGICVWGYQLSMRDVTDVPVVRAMVGAHRVLPDDPGGETTAHQGLAVNNVQSGGAAETPTDRVVLAPEPVRLSDEDIAQINLRPLAESPDLSNLRDVSASSSDSEADQINALVLEAIAQSNTARPNADIARMPGVKRSPRPRARVLMASLDGAGMRLNTPTQTDRAIDVDPSEILSGTRLVQLGAFDDRQTAIREWDAIVERHGDLIGARKRFIQEAESGGRRFYRLRMVGFDELSDSRRLCSALLARGTPCIPVTAR